MDILGPLPKTKQGSQFVVVMSDGHTKLAKSVPTMKTNSTAVAGIFLKHWLTS